MTKRLACYVADSRPPQRNHAKPIDCSSDAAALLDPWAGESREHFIALYLDSKHRPLRPPYVAHIGHMNACIVGPALIYREAIMTGAVAVVTAHNHPSGDTQPSREDLELVDRLERCGSLLGIVHLDHLVIATGGHLSVRDFHTNKRRF